MQAQFITCGTSCWRKVPAALMIVWPALRRSLMFTRKIKPFLFVSWCPGLIPIGVSPFFKKNNGTWSVPTLDSFLSKVKMLWHQNNVQHNRAYYGFSDSGVHPAVFQLTSGPQEGSVSRPCVVSSARPGRILHYLLFTLYTGGQRKWWGLGGKMPQHNRGLPVFRLESSCNCGCFAQEWHRGPQRKKPTAGLHRAIGACRPRLMKDHVCKGETKDTLTFVSLEAAALHCETFTTVNATHYVQTTQTCIHSFF